MKKFVMRHKEKFQVMFLAALFAVLAGIVDHNGCLDRDPLAEVNCAQYIEDLPEELYGDVNAACNQMILEGHVTAAETRRWFNQNRVKYLEVPFMFNPNLLGYVMPRSIYHEFYVMPAPSDSGELEELYPIMRRRVAFHETIHIMLIIKGVSFNNDRHHEFMDQNELCPGRCPEHMTH